jgi:hypothetical protein
MSNNTDSRSVHTDALATLGTIIDDTQKRDAIHLAVIPMVAKFDMNPGQHIDKDGEPVKAGKGVGIIDPFLLKPVKFGEHFWCVIYPRVITSLRHVWSHPAFAEETSVATTSDVDRAAAEAWLLDFVKRSDCPSIHTLMSVIEDGNSNGWGDDEYLCFSGSDAHGDIPEEFWIYAEAYLGHPIQMRPKYFSCSC